MNDFRSLDNVNSVLGERLHITETKNPAQTTQWCKNYFEKQTGTRYIEHLAATRAINNLSDDEKIVINESSTNATNFQYRRKIFFNVQSKQIKNSVHKQNNFRLVLG